MYSNVLSIGIFDILHPGHLRLFEFAKSISQTLTVALIDDSSNSSQPIKVREETLLECDLVDRVFIVDKELRNCSSLIEFDAIIQGSEFEENENFKQFVDTLNNEVKIIYWGTGSLAGFNRLAPRKSQISVENYKKRNKIEDWSLKKVFDKMKQLKVVVIGDTIVDKYIQAETVGISREDPTMVVRPIGESVFLGGAGIVAAHTAALVDKVIFISKGGAGPSHTLVEKKLMEYGVREAFFINQDEFQTTIKTRIRTGEKTQLRINEFDDFVLSNLQTEEIVQYLSSNKTTPDLVIFSDFSLGTFNRNNAQKLVKYFKDKNIFISADSQVSSKVGDLGLFVGADYVCPTETEARSFLRDQHSNIRELSFDIIEKIECKYCVQTLGSEGIFIATKSDSDNPRYDSLSALSAAPLDVAGAGDAFLVASSCALAAGGNIWEASLIGSYASKAQVERYGNIPLTVSDFAL